MLENQESALKVENVSKSFKLPHEKYTSLKSAMINFKGKKSYELQKALKDINLDIAEGEFFGIVGKNGSGKSTLLKLLANIYIPTSGTVTINGRLTPFIELGVGFNDELTGRENVFLNGALLGFSRKEMLAMYDDIVEFAELKRFMDQKLKNYSSGMRVRLAFSIAIRAQSDILLIDEVLAVGDEAFQQKCYAVFEDLKAQNRTIIFVSHDMGAVQRFCNRAALLSNGRIVDISNPKNIAAQYNKLNNQEVEKTIIEQNSKKSKNSNFQVKISRSSTSDSTTFDYGDDIKVTLKWSPNGQVKNAGIAIYTQAGQYIFGTNTTEDKITLQGNSISYKASLKVGDGNYKIVAGIFGEKPDQIIEFSGDGPRFRVTSKKPKNWEGLTYLTHSWGKE